MKKIENFNKTNSEKIFEQLKSKYKNNIHFHTQLNGTIPIIEDYNDDKINIEDFEIQIKLNQKTLTLDIEQFNYYLCKVAQFIFMDQNSKPEKKTKFENVFNTLIQYCPSYDKIEDELMLEINKTLIIKTEKNNRIKDIMDRINSFEFSEEIVDFKTYLKKNFNDYLKEAFETDDFNSSDLSNWLPFFVNKSRTLMDKFPTVKDDDGKDEDLDFENCEVISVDDNSIKFFAGGDWQEPLNVTMKYVDGKFEVSSEEGEYPGNIFSKDEFFQLLYQKDIYEIYPELEKHDE